MGGAESEGWMEKVFCFFFFYPCPIVEILLSNDNEVIMNYLLQSAIVYIVYSDEILNVQKR